MQWSGIHGGAAAPFEQNSLGNASVFQTRIVAKKDAAGMEKSRDIFPVGTRANMLEMNVSLKSRKGERMIHGNGLEYGATSVGIPDYPPAFSEIHRQVVEKPRRQFGNPQLNWESHSLPQFMGYGARYAIPSESTHEEDVGTQARMFPAQKSQWERMMSWMPRTVFMRAEGFQTTSTTVDPEKSLDLLQKFFRLFDFAKKYYLDATYPIPSQISSATYSTANNSFRYTDTTTNIIYDLNGSGTNIKNLFDKSNSTEWTQTKPTSWNTTAYNPSCWIEIRTSKASTLNAITVSRSSSSTGNSFNGFIIYGSNSTENDTWTEVFSSTTTHSTLITNSANTVAVRIPFTPVVDTAFIKYKVVFTGATVTNTNDNNIGMHTFQLEGGDVPQSLYNLVDSYSSFYTLDTNSNTYSFKSTPSLTNTALQKYRFYRWEITKIRTINDAGVQANRFRFIKEDGDEYKWKVTDISEAVLDTPGTSESDATFGRCTGSGTNCSDKYNNVLKLGTSANEDGDFATNPGGDCLNTLQDPRLNTIGYNETPSKLLLNNFTIDGVEQTLPIDKNTANPAKDINRGLKKWLDWSWSNTSQTGSSSIIFILQQPQLFTAYKFATGNDDDRRDPISWTLSAYTTNPYPNTDLTGGKNYNASPATDISGTILATVSNAEITTERNKWTQTFLVNPSHAGFQYTFGNAYKNLVDILIKKYKSVVESMSLQNDTTVINSLNADCKTTQSSSSSSIKSVYENSTVDSTSVTSFNVSSESTVLTISINSLENLDLILKKYIIFDGNSQTEAWPTLYQKIKCIALTPLQEYITFAESLTTEQIASLPSEFPSLSTAKANKDSIINTTNILSILTIVNLYKEYSTLIPKARIFFLIKQYQNLIDMSAFLFSGNIKDMQTLPTEYNIESSVSNISNLKNAYTEGTTYTTATGNPARLPIPTENPSNTNLKITYQNAIRRLTDIVKTVYKTFYEKFTGFGMPTTDLLGGYNSATSLFQTNVETSTVFQACNDFVKSDGYCHVLRDKIRRFLESYALSYNSIRSWASTSTTTSITIQNISTKYIGIPVANLPLSKTYSATSTSAPNYPALQHSWDDLSASMLKLIGSSDSSENSIRKAIADKITEVVNLYNTTENGITYSSLLSSNATFNWIPIVPSGKGGKVRQGSCTFGMFEYNSNECCNDEPTSFNTTKDDFETCTSECATSCKVTEDITKAAKSTDLQELVKLWNKYNIYAELNDKITEQKQLKYQEYITNYNNLRKKYIEFYTTNGTFVSPQIAELPTQYTEAPTVTVGTSGNYQTVYDTYGTPDTPNKLFSNLIAFVKEQMSTYIKGLYTQFVGRTGSVDLQDQLRAFDKSFFSETIKNTDLGSLDTKNASELITLLQTYDGYTNQFRIRDNRYNTLVIMDYFENLVRNNSSYTDIFPANLVVQNCAATATSTINTLTFTIENGSKLQTANRSNATTNKLGNVENTLYCDLIQDIDLVVGLEDFADLKTVQNKYTAAFAWLFGKLKTNMNTVKTSFESLHDVYTAFKTGFSTFYSIEALSISKTYPDLTTKFNTSFSTSLKNFQECIENFKSITDTYLVDTVGAIPALKNHINTEMAKFNTELETRIQSSNIPDTDKPVLPTEVQC